MTQIAKQIAERLVKNPSIKKEGLYINVYFKENDVIVVTYRYDQSLKPEEWMVSLTSAEEEKTKKQEGPKLLKGEISASAAKNQPEKSKGECLNAYIVEFSSTNIPGGYGRLLYYIAMHFAGKNGLTADRVLATAQAVGAWNNLYSDSEVQKEELDDFFNPKTTRKEDDCNQASSGIYGEEEPTETDKELSEPEKEKLIHSLQAHSWNPKLSSKEDKEYKSKKSSKLNFVYRANSADAISYLEDNNIPIVVNGVKKQKTKTLGRVAFIPKPISVKESRVFLYGILFDD